MRLFLCLRLLTNFQMYDILMLKILQKKKEVPHEAYHRNSSDAGSDSDRMR